MAHKEKFDNGDIGTWLQVHNLLPILTFLGGMIVMFYTFQGKMEVLSARQTLQEAEIQQLQINPRSNVMPSPTITSSPEVKGVSSPSAIFKKK